MVRFKLEDQAEEIWEKGGDRDQADAQSHHVRPGVTTPEEKRQEVLKVWSHCSAQFT